MNRPRLLGVATVAITAAVVLLAPSVAVGATSPTAVTSGSGPISVAVVVPLTAPVGTKGLIDSQTLETYTAPGGVLTRELDAVAGTTAAIGLDPMIPASIRLLGTTAPPSAVAWLAQLRAAPNEVFLLAYADADPVAAATAGALAELTPLNFDFIIDSTHFGPEVTSSPSPTGTATATPTPTATPTDNAPPPLPTLDDLLEWPTTLDDIAWPADGGASSAALTALTESGYHSVILNSSEVSRSDQAVVDLGSINALVADVPISSALRAANAASDLDAAQAQAALDAALTNTAATAPGRTVVATLDRSWAEGATRLPETLAAVEGLPASQLVSVSAVLAGPHVTGTVNEPTASAAAAAARASQLVTATRAESSYLTIATNPLIVSAPRRLALLALLGVGWQQGRNDPTVATEKFLTRSAAILSSVEVERGNDVLVLSDSSTIRVTVSNALPTSVTVYVTVVPLRPRLHVQETQVPLTIEPDSQNNVLIPVQSITNGDVNVQMSLTSLSGAPVGSPQLVKVILQAGWETAGTLIVGVLVVLVFGGGLVRRFLRRRRGTPDDVTD